MRSYYALVPMAQDGIARQPVVILPELDQIVRGVRARVFCTDESGAEIAERAGTIVCRPVLDCWLTSAAWIEEENGRASDAMYAVLGEKGRVVLRAATLPELAAQVRARLDQILAAAPPSIQAAWAAADPLAALVPQIQAFTDPGDVAGFAALKSWALSIAQRSPTAVVFPPGMRPVAGQVVPRYAALFAYRDLIDTKSGTHLLRWLFSFVDAAMYQAAWERLR